VFIWFLWWWAFNTPLSNVMNLSIIVGGVLLVFPLVWVGRMILDKQPTRSRVTWITTFVHYSLGILFGVAIIRAATTPQDWSGWTLPIPVEIGLLLVIITGVAFLLTVVNLARYMKNGSWRSGLEHPTWSTNPERLCCSQENQGVERCAAQQARPAITLRVRLKCVPLSALPLGGEFFQNTFIIALSR
jgi:uncharacterized integral membrane protein